MIFKCAFGMSIEAAKDLALDARALCRDCLRYREADKHGELNDTDKLEYSLLRKQLKSFLEIEFMDELGNTARVRDYVLLKDLIRNTRTLYLLH
jgi:hypothetical protein